MFTPSWSKLLAAVVLSGIGVPLARGHDVKALASQLVVAEAGGKTTIYLSWGDRLPVDDLIDPASIAQYDLLSPSGKVTPLKMTDLSLQTNVVELKEPGTYQVRVARKPATYTFVFDEDGKRQLKRGPKTTIKEGKIDEALRSLQTGKAVIVVGPAAVEPLKPAGLDLEIVPLEGPAAWKCGKPLRFQVLVQGKPLSGAEVRARYVGFKPDNGWCYATSTNRAGTATVFPSQAGTWVVRVHARQLAAPSTRELYDFESYTTTLTLEIQP